LRRWMKEYPEHSQSLPKGEVAPSNLVSLDWQQDG
jgi:hypothetical protein